MLFLLEVKCCTRAVHSDGDLVQQVTDVRFIEARKLTSPPPPPPLLSVRLTCMKLGT